MKRVELKKIVKYEDVLIRRGGNNVIGIVILTYNTWNDTEQCLESIIKLEMKVKYQIYVIDNCSQKSISMKCKKIIERNNLYYLRADKNRGYSAGNNLGIKRALHDGCEEIVIVNNDVVFTENVFEKMQLFIKSNSRVGMVGPKIFLGNGELQQTNLGCKMTIWGKYLYIFRKTPLKGLSQKFVSEFCLKVDELDKPKKVFGVSGCCFMISAACINEIGLLDEGTFLYEEENILGCKLEEKNFETYFLPELSIIHKHGQSTKYVKAYSFICFVESEIYYCRRYLNGNQLQLAVLYLIRISEYLVKCFGDKDYSKNLLPFLKKTMKMYWKRKKVLVD